MSQSHGPYVTIWYPVKSGSGRIADSTIQSLPGSGQTVKILIWYNIPNSNFYSIRRSNYSISSLQEIKIDRFHWQLFNTNTSFLTISSFRAIPSLGMQLKTAASWLPLSAIWFPSSDSSQRLHLASVHSINYNMSQLTMHWPYFYSAATQIILTLNNASGLLA